ncbi:MAG: hypothetical protein PVG83_08820 [Acidimicrobiia bacterium]
MPIPASSHRRALEPESTPNVVDILGPSDQLARRVSAGISCQAAPSTPHRFALKRRGDRVRAGEIGA